MPLPTADTEWPPKAYDEPRRKIAEWSAWYGGDPEDLRRFYGGQRADRPSNRPSQYRGGIVGWTARMFWGQPQPDGEPDERLHVPLADDLSAVAAGLLFGDAAVIKAQENDPLREATQKRLDLLAEDLHVPCLEGAEVGSALGGVFLRGMWDTPLRPDPWMSVVHADAAVPEWRYDQLAAVTFWWVIERDGNTIVRHLERHEPGVIEHGVYVGTADKLGSPSNLDRYTATKGLRPRIPTGIPILTAAHVPNVTPNRLWRDLPGACHLGRSDYAACEPLMDALDRTWSSLMRDLELGVGQILVSETMLSSLGPGRGAAVNQRRFTPLAILPKPGESTPAQAIQHAIRVQEHLTMAQAITQRVISDAGYSAQSFGLPGETAQTATESTNKREKSIVTTSRKGLHWRRGLAHMAQVLLMLGNRVSGWGVSEARPAVDLAEPPVDPKLTAETVELWMRAGAASREIRVRALHPDWDDSEVMDEVARIEKEEAAAVPVADAFGADPGADPQATEDDPDAGGPFAR